MYYKVDMNGKYVGQIWREFPEELPNDWTIGVKMEAGNSVMPLDHALAYLSNTYPGIKLTRIEEEEDKMEISSFKDKLISLINTHNQENNSDTPDFILGEYLLDCLKAFDKATNARIRWYGDEKKGSE